MADKIGLLMREDGVETGPHPHIENQNYIYQQERMTVWGADNGSRIVSSSEFNSCFPSERGEYREKNNNFKNGKRRGNVLHETYL